MNIELNKINIKIDHENDINLIFKKFLFDLEKCDFTFLENKKKMELEFEKFKIKLDKENFLPESLISESPITILSGGWGTGKTFFIEEIKKAFYLDEITSDIFEKILIINLFNFYGSDNFDKEVIYYILNEISSVIKNKLVKDKIKKISRNLFSIFAPKLVINFWSKNNKNINQDIKSFKKCLDKHPLPKTIIFLDNFERIGSDCWNIIKLIKVIFNFKNLFFIIVTDLDKLNKSNVGLGEFPIEKFINTTYFEFEENFKLLLKSLGVKNSYINTFNDLFSYKINNKLLTQRQIESRFKHLVYKNEKILYFLNNDDFYKSLKWVKLFWPVKQKFEYYLSYLTKPLSNLLEEISLAYVNIQWIIDSVIRDFPQCKDEISNSNIFNDLILKKYNFNLYKETVLKLIFLMLKEIKKINLGSENEKKLLDYKKRIDYYFWIIDKKAFYWEKDKSNFEFSNDICVYVKNYQYKEYDSEKLFNEWFMRILS